MLYNFLGAISSHHPRTQELPEMDDTSSKNIKDLIQDELLFINENQKELDVIVKKIIKNK